MECGESSPIRQHEEDTMSKKLSVATLAAAVEMAERGHAGQQRKGCCIPYISHPLAVASLVLDHGGDTEEAIAALLHDVIEDGSASFAWEIEKRFGKRVLALVEACTDGTAEGKAKAITPAAKRADWYHRKRRYLERLKTEDSDDLLVAACDKLHNARAIVADLEQVGPTVFDRFTAGREGTLWYYDSTLEILRERGSSIAEPLAVALTRMHELSEPLGSGTDHDDAQTLLDDLLGRLCTNERAGLRRLLATLEAGAQRLVAESARAMSGSSALHQQLGNLLLQIDAGVRHAH
jgi:hypothetical protein